MSTELERIGEDTQVAVIASETIGVISKSEVEAQLDAAHKYPRSIKRFLDDAITLATFDKEVAMSCIYALPRDGKMISGPSVRLAEICASAYGNLHMGARVIGIEDKEIIAQGVTWDLEKNNRVTIEVRRRITDRKGRRYNDDMITLTGNAAASIGYRNSIFRIIPKAYVNAVYQKAREVSVGNAFTLSETRAKVMERLTKMGVSQDRILTRIARASVADVTLDDVELLIGLGTAIKNGDINLDDTFPPVENLTTEKGKSVIERIVEQKKTESAAAAAATQQPNQGGGDTGKDPVAPAADPEAVCTTEQFDELQILQTEHDVEPKVFMQYVKQKLGYRMVAHLKQKEFERAKQFLQNGGNE